MDTIVVAALAVVMLLVFWYVMSRPDAGSKSNFGPSAVGEHPSPFQYKIPGPPVARTPAEMAALEARASNKLRESIAKWQELESQKAAAGKSGPRR